MARESTFEIDVLIPKGCSGDFRGIGLVEVLWKAVTSLMNQGLMAVIKFHDVLHRFWEGRGTGTAALEVNLLQHLTVMREEVLFEVFLDLQKAYGALDRDRCLEILEAFGVGPRVIKLLLMYWYRLTMVARSGR